MSSTSMSDGDDATGKIGGALGHIVQVCRYAASQGGVGVLSTGEGLAAALVLNRADWLTERGYTMIEALNRIGEDWVAQLGNASKVLEEDARVAAVVAEGVAKASVRPAPASSDGAAGGVTKLDYQAKLVTYGEAPGYRDAYLELDLREIDGTTDGHRFRAGIHLNAADSADIAQHIMRIHAFAWSTERGPIDKNDGEKRPNWLR